MNIINKIKQIDKIIIRLIIAIILFIISFTLPINYSNIVKIIAILIIGYDLLIETIKNIFKLEIFNEEVLMTIASISAILINEINEAFLLLLLFQIGEYLNDYIIDKSKEDIKNLMSLKIKTVSVIKNDKVKTIKIENIKPNDVIIIKPGDEIPVDGIIVEGETTIDTKSLTGESLPQKKSIEEEVISGSINLTNAIKVKALKKYKDSTLNKILELIEESENKKTKTEKFITRFSNIYTKIIFTLAILIILYPLIRTGSLNSKSIYNAIVFIVTSCPCALIISIPLSFFVGIAKLSKNGILVKGSNDLETLAKIKNIIFDKTGTLTIGEFRVTKVYTENEEELFYYLNHAEYFSSHPIRTAIYNYKKIDINPNKIGEYEEIGRGITCKIDRKKVIIGNKYLMNDNSIKIDEINEIGTIVYVAVANKCIGSIVISDSIKLSVKDALNDLRKLGIENMAILSGDNDVIVNAISQELEINDKYSNLLPQDKVFWLNYLKDRYKGLTAFIGDGINDAPVLLNADLGISMGKIGADVTIEASDVVIMNDDLQKLPLAIKIARNTKKVAIENIALALFFKLSILLISMFGNVPIWMAVFGDVGVTLITILNSLRIYIRR